MRRVLFVVGATGAAAGGLVWAGRTLDPRRARFAFLVVWVPMTWLGTISRVVQPRLPQAYHELRAFERDGRIYELMGIRAVKWLLRRGPMAVFNPDLHLPPERSPARLVHLDQRMRDAEASHAVLFVATLPVIARAVGRRWWSAAGLTLVFDVAMNGYPVLLQRYNRALLHRCYPDLGKTEAQVGSARPPAGL